MDETERLDALRIALNNELKERTFYLKHAQRTKNPLGKKMFQQIGDEELEHYERLKELNQRWEKQEKWPATIPLKVKDTEVRGVFHDLLKKVDTLPEGDGDDLDAVKTAIAFEAKGMKHYETLRDMVSNPQEKAFFDLLAGIEREHYLSLKNTEEYFTDPASWYRREEHHMFDGP